MRMQYRISYETSTLTDDTMGGQTETWAEARELYADVKEEDGSRILEGGKVRYYKRYKITCRKQKDLTIDANGRIVYDGKTLVIESVLEKQKRFLEIEASSND